MFNIIRYLAIRYLIPQKNGMLSIIVDDLISPNEFHMLYGHSIEGFNF